MHGSMTLMSCWVFSLLIFDSTRVRLAAMKTLAFVNTTPNKPPMKPNKRAGKIIVTCNLIGKTTLEEDYLVINMHCFAYDVEEWVEMVEMLWFLDRITNNHSFDSNHNSMKHFETSSHPNKSFPNRFHIKIQTSKNYCGKPTSNYFKKPKSRKNSKKTSKTKTDCW